MKLYKFLNEKIKTFADKLRKIRQGVLNRNIYILEYYKERQKDGKQKKAIIQELKEITGLSEKQICRICSEKENKDETV